MLFYLLGCAPSLGCVTEGGCRQPPALHPSSSGDTRWRLLRKNVREGASSAWLRSSQGFHTQASAGLALDSPLKVFLDSSHLFVPHPEPSPCALSQVGKYHAVSLCGASHSLFIFFGCLVTPALRQLPRKVMIFLIFLAFSYC